MKNISKRFLACLLALTLLVTCGLSGLVLPVAAAEYAEVGTNIAVNGDFETGTGWSSNANYTAKEGVGFGGTTGLEMTATKSTLYYNTKLTLRPNSTYELTFLAKGYYIALGSGGSSKFTDVDTINTSNILTTTTSTDWVKYRVVFNTGDAPSIASSYGLCLKRSSAAPEGSVTYVDNWEIRELSEAAKSESIAGGDFSGYWSEEFSEMFKAAGATTGYALETEGENTYVKFPAAKAEAYLKGLDVQGSTKYRLSFKAKGGVLGVYFNETHTTGGGWQLTTASEDWQTYSFDFVTAASPNKGFVLCFGKGNSAMSSSGTDAATYIDDVSITPVTTEPATAIALDKTTLSLGVNATATLTVVPTPENGTYDAVVWSSDNTAVATVVDGVVTAVGTGTATITATAGALTATCTVTVMEQATAIALDTTALHLAPGTVKTVVAVATPAGADMGALSWTSSDTAVATVEGGKITAVAAGEATVTVSNGTLSATMSVKVSDNGELITGGDFENNDWDIPLWTTNLIKDGAGTVVTEAGGNTVLQLKPSTNAVYFQGTPVKGDTAYVLTYQAKGGTVRTSISGTHAASGSGWANTTLKADEWTTITRVFTTKSSPNKSFILAIGATTDTPTYIDNVSLVALPAATALKLDKTAATVNHEQTLQLTVSTEPELANAGTLTWTSSNTAVATVDQTGLVTAVASGEATITVSNGTLTATCVITVPQIADTFALKEQSLYFAVGTAKTLTVVTEGGLSAGELTWATSDAAVATVENGKVTAVANGTATVTATNFKGVTATVTVKVDAYGERLTGGDFENNDWNTKTLTTNIIKDGRGTVVTEADGNNVLQIPADVSSTLYFAPAPIEGSKTYIVTLKAKGVSVRTHVIRTHNAAGDLGEKTTTLKADEWTTVSIMFTTKEDPNKNYAIAVSNRSGEVLTIDDITWNELPDAESLVITPEAVELLPNGTSTMKVSAMPALSNMGAVTWSSSDPNVVSVDQEGNIAAVAKNGTATITVTNDKGKTATATVVINEYANLLTNGDFELGNTLYYNDSANLGELILPGIGKDGSYGLRMHNTSGKTKTTTYYRKALPLSPGTTYILTFDYVATTSDNIRLWSGTMGFGNVYTSKGKGEWKTATKIFTTPADMALNTNWDLGIVCDGEGSEASVIDNLSLKLYNTGVEAQSITLSRTTMTLIPGRTGSLAAYATPTDGDTNQMTWTSSDENVATVEYGVVTGVGKGTAIITGTTKNGKSATCTVTVSGNETFVLNGTFDDADDDSWTFADGASKVEGAGVSESVAAELVTGSTVSQIITGEFKPETEYQLFVRYRTPNKSTANVVLADGDVKLVEAATGTAAYWTKSTFEFKTGETAPETLTLSFTLADGNGPVYIDNVILAQKASLIDLVVESIIWDGGDGEVKPGDKLTFATTIRNQGEDEMKANQSFDVNICLDGEVVQTMTYAGQLGSGDSTVVISETPWTATELGDHVISAHVNPTLTVLEINDANNTSQVNLRIAEERLEVPEQALAAGMTNLIFSDDFDSDKTIDKYATGDHGYKWYVTAQWGNGTASPDDYSVEDGILKLHRGNTPNNITLSTMDINTGNGFSWNTGYLEFRIRVVDADGAQVNNVGNVPAIWSFPVGKHMEIAGQNEHYVEMDWMEYWGLDTAKWPTRPDGYYTISLHDCAKDENGGYDNWTSNTGSSGRYQNGLGDEEWHVMGFRWEKGKLAAFYDGEKIFEQKWSEDGEPSPKVSDQSGLPISDATGMFSLIDEQFNILYLSAHEKNPLEVDYIRIWQGDGSIVSPDDPIGDEEGEPGDIVVDIEPEQFWYNYCTDDWGDTIVTVNEENYLNILSGQAIWEALTDERRTQINEYLAGKGQPPYEELLKAALAIQNGESEQPAPQPTPDTGSHTALPAAAIAASLGAAVLWITRKRKHS